MATCRMATYRNNFIILFYFREGDIKNVSLNQTWIQLAYTQSSRFDVEVMKELSDCIKQHQMILEICKQLENFFSPVLFFKILISIILFCLLGFCIVSMAHVSYRVDSITVI